MPDTLNVVTLVGSLRRASYNAAIARALPGLAPEGMTIAPLGSIGDLPLYNADIQAQGFPAPVTAMAEAIRAADGLIFVTPEYNYSVPGVLKNAIDWASRPPSQPFDGKPVAIMGASGGPLGTARGPYALRKILVYMNTFTGNKPEVFIGMAQTKLNAQGELNDEATKKFIGALLVPLQAQKKRPK